VTCGAAEPGERAFSKLRQSGTHRSARSPTNGGWHGPSFPVFDAPTMDPQSFIVGLMAGITLFGGAILTAMILLERPRCGPRRCSRFFAMAASRLRDWLEPKWPRRKLTEDWLQAEEDHARLRETASQQLEGRRGPAQPGGLPPGPIEKKEPPHKT
jgi:hypothetical protein